MVVVPEVAMIGRSAEIRRLVELAKLTLAGRGAIVGVEGEAGIGKTTLLDALAAEATRLGVRVRRATAEETTPRLPFAALAECLGLRSPVDGGLDESGPGGGGLGESAPASLEFARAESILTAVETWCASSPVVLLLDDAQWLDPASLRALRRVSRVLVQLPLLLVLASRPAGTGTGTGTGPEPAVPLASIGAAGDVLRLGPLTDAEVDDLLTGLVGGRPGPLLRAGVDAAGGNPLHLTELASLLCERPGIRVVAGIAEPAGPLDPVPPALTGAVLGRISRLSAAAQQAVRTAAVLGPRFRLAELAAALGRTAGLLPALQEGIQAGLLGGV